MKINQHESKRRNKLQICIFVIFAVICLLYVSYSVINPSLSKLKSENAMSEISDYNYLINITFTFTMLPLVCHSNETLLLILIHTATDHIDRRNVIRDTWGQNRADIKVLFLIGAVEQDNVQKDLEAENKLHNDLVQGNFLDTYHNLTYKHVMALKYALYHCSKVPYVLKLDDDVFVNTPVLKIFLQIYKGQHKHVKKIFCSRFFNSPVVREGKWEVSLSEYPESNYPPYCEGFAILYPYDTLYPLYSGARKTKFLWVDDAYVTGVVAKNYNISHIGIEKFILSNEDLRNIIDNSFVNITKPFFFVKIHMNETEIRYLWNFVKKYSPLSRILEYLEY